MVVAAAAVVMVVRVVRRAAAAPLALTIALSLLAVPVAAGAGAVEKYCGWGSGCWGGMKPCDGTMGMGAPPAGGQQSAVDGIGGIDDGPSWPNEANSSCVVLSGTGERRKNSSSTKSFSGQHTDSFSINCACAVCAVCAMAAGMMPQSRAGGERTSSLT